MSKFCLGRTAAPDVYLLVIRALLLPSACEGMWQGRREGETARETTETLSSLLGFTLPVTKHQRASAMDWGPCEALSSRIEQDGSRTSKG